MADKTVVQGESELREKCDMVTQFDEVLSTLVEDLIQTMDAHHALSLAAPQIGAAVQVAVIHVGQRIVELINPTILETEGLQTGVESCASFPGLALEVQRPARIKVASADRTGRTVVLEESGLLARLIAHELDHLAGVLFYDHIGEDDLFLQIVEQVTGADPAEEEDNDCIPADEGDHSELAAAKEREKVQIIDMLADAAWKSLLAVTLLEEDPEAFDTPSMAHLKTLADDLRRAADEWETRLLGSD